MLMTKILFVTNAFPNEKAIGEITMEYCQEKMRHFIKRDALLNFAVNNLVMRGHEEEAAMRIVFNGYVLEDSIMEDIYKSL